MMLAQRFTDKGLRLSMKLYLIEIERLEAIYDPWAMLHRQRLAIEYEVVPC